MRTILSKQHAFPVKSGFTPLEVGSRTFWNPLNTVTSEKARSLGCTGRKSLGFSSARLLTGFTLIELVVSVGLFALVMTLASGAYLIMIAGNRQTQALTNGTNNLSYALEYMMRDIRTGSAYSCNGIGDCPFPGGGTSFSFVAADGTSLTFARSTSASVCGSANACITQNGTPLTDPTVNVTSLTFYVTGTARESAGDTRQPYVTAVVQGTVQVGPGRTPQTFQIESSSSMRGTDL